MEYVLRVAGILGEAIPLVQVADAIARVRATGRGAAPFNHAAYKGFFDKECTRLLHDAEAGTLRVCDDHSHAATPKEIYAKADCPPGYNDPGRISHLYTRIAYLDKWAQEDGDSYALDPLAGPWVEAITVEEPGSPEFIGPGKPKWSITRRGTHTAKTKENAASASIETPVATRKLQSTIQTDLILATLKSCGYDPLKLPTSQGSKSGPKKVVRCIVECHKKVFVSPAAFDSAWARMKVAKDIVDAPRQVK